MFILNRYNITATTPNAAAGAVSNVNPSVVDGATGNSAAGDSVTPIITSAVYMDQVISKLVAVTIPATGLLAANNNYVTVPLSNLGITGTRPVLAAVLLGVYNSNSTETAIGGANGGTPSFIGMWDKTAANVNSVCIQASNLVLRIPTAQINLFAAKTAMIQLFYSTNAGV
jgi:hypothetical protein